MSTQLNPGNDYKVYVMLGFHANFYHSWRGDTPDEAGFGTDIRVVRDILRRLDRANAQGLQAKGYWDFDVYWTLERIIPEHAPDILSIIRRRVEDGLDEIVLDYYNNGANHAATERELRTSVKYAFENPHGSGLRQLFGRTTTLLRPQESMYTTGQNAVLLDEGISGLVLYYSGTPFNSLSNFLPVLPTELRYGLFRMKASEDDPPIEVWPCISTGDLVEHVSLEALLRKLRGLQNSGQVQSDLLVHLNVDADSDTWLPVGVPGAFAWFPNTGGLEEYIRIVNRYPWAEFTVPSEYRLDHEPAGEFIVHQDLADGGFDGNYSWAEKYSSLVNWTLLEQSRLHTYRAMALADCLPEEVGTELRHQLWAGSDSAFFKRLVGLSTTHFGMSTPLINEQREARARELLGLAADQARSCECKAAGYMKGRAQWSGEPLYVFEIHAVHTETGVQTDRAIVRVPLILPPELMRIDVRDTSGRSLPTSLLNLERLPDGRYFAELTMLVDLTCNRPTRFTVHASDREPASSKVIDHLANDWITLHLSEACGVERIEFAGEVIGEADFLDPFITYRTGRKPVRCLPVNYTISEIEAETWSGLTRTRLKSRIRMHTPEGAVHSDLTYTFTLFDALPYLLVDIDVVYADTPRDDIIQTAQQSLRRRLDLRWLEVAPFQLNPRIFGNAQKPIRVWKHNYLGVTSHYDLDYGQINPFNRNLDSFNHQVTAGWIAVSNGSTGLLLAECAEVLTSMAFCPMRLREKDRVQQISLNPFGSYYGKQFDYSHLGGNGIGAAFTVAASGALRSNAPSFNGKQVRFSLMLAPYQGDQPASRIQSDALSFFYPPGVVYLQMPGDMEAVIPEDIHDLKTELIKSIQIDDNLPFPRPVAFLANPTDGGVDLVWEKKSDPRVIGYDLGWMLEGEREWQVKVLPDVDRWQIRYLNNRSRYLFRLRSRSNQSTSDWTRVERAIPGASIRGSLLSFASGVSIGLMVRMVLYSLGSVIKARSCRTR